jgi:hypothetical protein
VRRFFFPAPLEPTTPRPRRPALETKTGEKSPTPTPSSLFFFAPLVGFLRFSWAFLGKGRSPARSGRQQGRSFTPLSLPWAQWAAGIGWRRSRGSNFDLVTWPVGWCVRWRASPTGASASSFLCPRAPASPAVPRGEPQDVVGGRECRDAQGGRGAPGVPQGGMKQLTAGAGLRLLYSPS